MLVLSFLIYFLGLIGMLPSLAKYVTTFYTYVDGKFVGMDSDKNYLILTVVFLFITVFGIYLIDKSLKKKDISVYKISGILGVNSLIIFIHFLAVIIKCIVKGKPYSEFFMFLIPAAFASLIFIGLFIALYLKEKKQK